MAATKERLFTTRKMAVCAMFVACLAVCSQLAIPSPVGLPFSLQTFAVLMAALLLPPVSAVVVVAVYLLLGVVGLPVFAAAQGGFGVLLGPSGGFLWAFLPAAFVISRVCRLKRNRVFTVMAVLLGLLIIYLGGLWQFGYVAGLGMKKILLTVCLPCLPGEVVKSVLAVVISESLHRRGFVF